MNALTRKLATAGSALVMAASGLLFASSPASAATSCFASGCQGLDPASTVCQNDARTVATTLFGTELRYSPGCRTTWARLTGNKLLMDIRVESSTGAVYSARYTSGGTAWTRMVNDKDLLARACDREADGGGWSCSAQF